MKPWIVAAFGFTLASWHTGVRRIRASLPAAALGGTACESDRDCAPIDGRQGRCFTPSLAAQYSQAFRDCADGRAWRSAHSPGTCVWDECRADSAPSCAPTMRCSTLDMAPFPQRVCVAATCQSDFDCRREPFGRCAGYFNAGRCARGGWACSYPSDACAPRDPGRMCPVHRGLLPFCAPRNGRFVCVQAPALVNANQPAP